MTRVFEIPGEPRGKGRPRFSRRSGAAYTDQKTAAYENLVAVAYRAKYSAELPIETAVVLTATAYMPIPKSTSKKRRAAMLAGEIRPTKKPDLDNILKAILDGLNGVAFRDDSQVVTIITRKEYSETPCLTVALEEKGGME